MKLALTLDLAPLRQRALEAIDHAVAQRVALDEGLAPLYRLKLRDAEAVLKGAAASQQLAAEASLKKLSPRALAEQIVAKNAEAELRLAGFEMLRQSLKDQIAAAAGQQEIDQLVATFGAALHG